MLTNKKARIGIAGLAISAASYVGLITEEGYTDKAVIPVKGDVPTVGFGSTVREDGSKVQMGDTITPQKAAIRTLAHIQKDENGIRACVRNPVTQGEYDLLVGFAYQYGATTTCRSGMVKAINEGRYADSCSVYLQYRFVAGRDCSVRSNNCYGVADRAKRRYEACLEEQ